MKKAGGSNPPDSSTPQQQSRKAQSNNVSSSINATEDEETAAASAQLLLLRPQSDLQLNRSSRAGSGRSSSHHLEDILPVGGAGVLSTSMHSVGSRQSTPLPPEPTSSALATAAAAAAPNNPSTSTSVVDGGSRGPPVHIGNNNNIQNPNIHFSGDSQVCNLQSSGINKYPYHAIYFYFIR